MSVLIKGGKVVTADKVMAADVLIAGDRIQKIAPAIDEKAEKVIDASGCYVLPGLIDMHVHLREPGFEGKEDIASGTKAAAAGGFTAVCCMPNTKPVLDNATLIKYIKYRAKEVGLAEVFPIGAITKGSLGEELADLRLMREAGAVAFSDDGKPVENARLMRNALLYTKDFDGLIISHSEDISLSDGGSANDGYNASIAGIKGIPASSETVAAARDILLAAETGARVHIAHVSAKATAEFVAYAKSKGWNVTAETCPQYLFATDKEILDYNTNAKINPPLKTEEDRLALIEAVKNGTIDVLATDHAPHTFDDKNTEFQNATFGSVGLESAVGLYVSRLIDSGIIDWVKFARLASANPARILRLEGRGEIKEGNFGDITIIDPDAKYTFDTAKTFSKSRNSLFEGWQLKGRAAYTIVKGKVIYSYKDDAKK